MKSKKVAYWFKLCITLFYYYINTKVQSIDMYVIIVHYRVNKLNKNNLKCNFILQQVIETSEQLQNPI